MAITKEPQRLLSSKTICIRVTNVRSRSYIYKAKRRKEEGRQIMWPYTDEEADFLNGKKYERLTN